MIKTDARDEMVTIFKTAWDPTLVPVSYEDVKTDIPGSSNAAYATVRIQWTLSSQKGTGTPVNGPRRYVREGLLTVQIFTPFGEGLVQSDSLSTIAQGAFEGKKTPGGVEFFNVRDVTVGRSGEFHQVNIIAEFMYDEVK